MRITNIQGCNRCGQDHLEVDATKLDNPFSPPEAGGITWTHWAPCPKNGQPILFVLTSDVEKSGTASDLPSGSTQFEDVIEWCYWRFDSLRAGTAPDRKEAGLGPQEERDAYKAVMRAFYGKWRLPTQ